MTLMGWRVLKTGYGESVSWREAVKCWREAGETIIEAVKETDTRGCLRGWGESQIQSGRRRSQSGTFWRLAVINVAYEPPQAPFILKIDELDVNQAINCFWCCWPWYYNNGNTSGGGDDGGEDDEDDDDDDEGGTRCRGCHLIDGWSRRGLRKRRTMKMRCWELSDIKQPSGWQRSPSLCAQVCRISNPPLTGFLPPPMSFLQYL